MESDKYGGKIIYRNTENEGDLIITKQAIIVKFEKQEICLMYKNIIFFALNQKENFLLIQYSISDDEEGDEIKYTPTEGTCLQEVYNLIQEYNLLNPSEEFKNEPEGENELFTADKLNN
jgi:hypothetical protein